MTKDDMEQLEATIEAMYRCTLKKVPGASYRMIVNAFGCELGELCADGTVV